jgi:hypothetical protein
MSKNQRKYPGKYFGEDKNIVKNIVLEKLKTIEVGIEFESSNYVPLKESLTIVALTQEKDETKRLEVMNIQEKRKQELVKSQGKMNELMVEEVNSLFYCYCYLFIHVEQFKNYSVSVDHFSYVTNTVLEVFKNIKTLKEKLNTSEQFFSYKGEGLENRDKELEKNFLVETLLIKSKQLLQIKALIEKFEECSLFYSASRLITVVTAHAESKKPIPELPASFTGVTVPTNHQFIEKILDLKMMSDAKSFYSEAGKSTLRGKIIQQVLNFLFRRPIWDQPDFVNSVIGAKSKEKGLLFYLIININE